MPASADRLNADELTIVIAGGGNASHVLLALLGSNPKYTVRLWNVVAKEVDTFKSQLALNNNQMKLYNIGGETETQTVGKVDRVSTDPAEVMPGADLLLIAVPAFAHEVYLKGAVPYASSELAVGCMVAEGGFDWQLRDTFKDLFPNMVTFAGETLPWACRLKEYGASATIQGTKQTLSVAITPASATEGVLRFLNTAISIGNRPQFTSSGNYLAPTLTNINAFFHPAIVMGQFEHWDGKAFEKAPPFYEGATQEGAGDLIEALSAEVMAVKKAVSNAQPQVDLSTVIPIRDFFMNAYREDVSDASCLAKALNTNKGYRGLTHYMKPAEDGNGVVPNWTARYLTEDIPFGLVPMKGIAQVMGVPSPTLDRVIHWCQEKMGKEYVIEDKLAGKDISETRCPQRYGFTSIEQMVTIVE